jgi:hypothetical protein
MWYAIVTMTTVGYGDYFPTTPAGKAVGCITMLCGIMVLALPITVVGSAFTEEYQKFKEKVKERDDAIVKKQQAEVTAAAEVARGRSRGSDAARIVPMIADIDESFASLSARGEAHPQAAAESGSSANMARIPIVVDADHGHSRSSSLANGVTGLSKVQPAPVEGEGERAEGGAGVHLQASTALQTPTQLRGDAASVNAQLEAVLHLLREQGAELAQLRSALGELKGRQGQ